MAIAKAATIMSSESQLVRLNTPSIRATAATLMIDTLVILLAAVLLLIPLSRRAGFGSVLGYLVGGALIGPSGLRLITDVDAIRGISELGVVMLLFLIGLELRPQRLWVMRKSVFGLGPAQVVVTGAALAGLSHLAGLPWPGAVVVGGGLALSSTAIVLPMLAERQLLSSVAGRDAFAVLLLQDLAFIPMAALVPLIAGGMLPTHTPWLGLAKGAAAIVALLLAGLYLVGPAFRLIGGARTPEVFNAMALFIVLGAAALAHAAGLSMSLGAFLGGVMLSSSEYRHELQADIEPFEGLLLGFFFMSVGMSANLALALSEPALIGLGVAALVVTKVAVAFVLGRLRGEDNREAIRFSLALSQGSEFSFVLFGTAVAVGGLSRADSDRATLVIALSMVATPILFALSETFLLPRFARLKRKPVYDRIEDHGTPVIICGFGRFGQIVGRVLRTRGIRFTALDKDSEQVEAVRRFGSKVYFGNPARPDVLRAAGAETARVLVVTLPDMEETLRVVEMAHRTFPDLKIFVRARNRRHAHLLMDRDVDGFVRETFYSSLKLGELVLQAVDVPRDEARRAVELFREHDERTLAETHAFYEDERQLMQSARQAQEELSGLLEADMAAKPRSAAQ